MPHVDASGLLELDDLLEEVAEEMPDLRRKYHADMADIMEKEIYSAIDTTMNDPRGTVKRWQVKKMGSGGGYALLRPKGSREGAEVGPEGPGAKTNYTDKGHKIRKPSGKGKNYRPRIKVPKVKGRNYYQKARASVEGKSIQRANQLADDIARKLGG